MGPAALLAERWKGKLTSKEAMRDFIADSRYVWEALTNVIACKLARGAKPYQMCVFRSFAIKMLLDSVNVESLLQAGSASFKFRDIPIPDDGKPTHLSYESASYEHIRGMMRETTVEDLDEYGMTLPEMHCWVGLMQYQMIIDTSTEYLPLMAVDAGYKWEAPQPPAFLAATIDELPAGWIYLPTEHATKFLNIGLAELYKVMGY